MPLSDEGNKGIRGLEKVPRWRQRLEKSGNADEHLEVGSLLVALCCVVEEAHLLGPGQRAEVGGPGSRW